MKSKSNSFAPCDGEQPRFVYVSIIRTGSRSLRTTLFPGNATSVEAPCYWNKSAVEIREDFRSRGWDWDAAYKFSVVRNPWDRLVSAYHFWKPSEDQPLGEAESTGAPMEFNSWIRTLVALENSSNKLFVRQGSLLVDASGELLVDHVYRFESLQDEWDNLSRLIGVKKQLPHTHKTVHRHYSRYYDTQATELIREACRDDIERFGYQFQNLSGREELVDEARFRLSQSRHLLRTTARDSLGARAPEILELLRRLRRR